MPGPCEVCSSEPSKYRCPTCELMSCSLACAQSHKIYCAPKPTPANGELSEGSTIAHQVPGGTGMNGGAEETEKKTEVSFPASSEIKELLHHHPQLRSQLYEIYRSTQEEEWVEWYNPPSKGRPHGRGGRPPLAAVEGPGLRRRVLTGD
ncbi:hypothetical protein N7512_002733 [Penicillium capsulatum]|nr:hypothetical protein N7512_002733 [Penicillium capsulatum]